MTLPALPGILQMTLIFPHLALQWIATGILRKPELFMQKE